MSPMFKISHKNVFISFSVLCIQLVKGKSIMSIIVIFKTKMVSRPRVFIVVMASLILYAESGTSTIQSVIFFGLFVPLMGLINIFVNLTIYPINEAYICTWLEKLLPRRFLEYSFKVASR